MLLKPPLKLRDTPASFTVTAASIFAGELLLPTSSPLPFFAYPFLVATLVGWAWILVRDESPRRD